MKDILIAISAMFGLLLVYVVCIATPVAILTGAVLIIFKLVK